MVMLGVIKFRYRADLCGDTPIAFLSQAGLKTMETVFSLLELFVIERIDTGAVLGPQIVALTHTLRGIVAFPEKCKQVLVVDDGWIKNHQYDLVMSSQTGTDFLVGRIGSVAA